MNADIQPLILCGGAGVRLWPASRDSMPKQFALLLGNLSTFQQTVLRVQGPGFVPRPLVMTSTSHRMFVEQQLAELHIEADLLLEPVRRDSGPAIAAGCAAIAERDDDTPILAIPSDHVVHDVAGFQKAIFGGLPAALAGHLVTFGIIPTHPATEYGYIEPGPPISAEARRVLRFAEKPLRVTAATYVASGLLWNSGNFLFTARTLLNEYHRLDPSAFACVCQAVIAAAEDRGARALERTEFSKAQPCSIDYAIMEKSDRIAVVAMNCGWSDIGTWDAVWSVGSPDNAGNVTRGDVELLDAHNCLVFSTGPLTSVLGLEDVVIVASNDAILVTHRESSSEIKGLVQHLRSKGRTEADVHPRVHRPWGWYEVIDIGDRFQVKRIAVHPGGLLSLQKHRHRAEHWVVVRGMPRVTVGDQVSVVNPNEHVYIPIGAVHRLENPGDSLVELVEVQTGGYLGEDDIVRLEDMYNRK